MSDDHTCPFPGCCEPPDTVTTMWARLGSQVLLVEVKVCPEHKRMNEAESE